MAPRLLALLLVATLARAEGDDDRFWRPLDRRDGLPSDHVLDLCGSGPARIWAATAAGLVRIEAHGIRKAPLPGVARLVAPAPDGQVYALYATGIVRIGEEVAERIDLPVDPAREQPDAMEARADGTLLLRIRDEGYVRPPGGAWRREGEGPPPRASIEHRGETWMATRDRGILRRRREPYFRNVPLETGPRVHALAAAPDGTIWCGTNQGLAIVRPDGGVEERTAIDGTPLGVVTACAVDREGRVWLGSGSSFRGVYRKGRSGWQHLKDIRGFVHRITADPSGALWFAVLNPDDQSPEAARGAWYFADGEFRPAPGSLVLPSARVYDVVARDPRGTLWFATLRGLAAYEGPGRLTHYTPETWGLRGEKVWCLCAGRDGSLWLGYQQAPGASRLAHGEIEHFDVDDGLCDGNVWAIAEGRPGVFWFATASGLSRYDGWRWSCFRNEEGLGEEAIWPLLPLEDGTLWIGTLGAGLVHAAPRDRDPPRTRFPEASYEADEGNAVEVSWRSVDAWFETAAADLRYRWRLDGGRWSDVTAATTARVEAAPGEHVLQVQAIDRFGNAEDPPAAVGVAVRPAARFPWLPAGAIGTALLLAGYVIGSRVRRRGS